MPYDDTKLVTCGGDGKVRVLISYLFWTHFRKSDFKIYIIALRRIFF